WRWVTGVVEKAAAASGAEGAKDQICPGQFCVPPAHEPGSERRYATRASSGDQKGWRAEPRTRSLERPVSNSYRMMALSDGDLGSLRTYKSFLPSWESARSLPAGAAIFFTAPRPTTILPVELM